MAYFTEKSIKNAKKRVAKYNNLNPEKQLSLASVKLVGKKDKDGYGTYRAKKK